MKLNLDAELEYTLERIKAAEELKALEEEYEKTFGERPNFDPLKHRKRAVYINELTGSIEAYKKNGDNL